MRGFVGGLVDQGLGAVDPPNGKRTNAACCSDVAILCCKLVQPHHDEGSSSFSDSMPDLSLDLVTCWLKPLG